MAVKKIGKRWHPIGKKGPWKSSFPTEAAAKKALTKSNKYFKSRRTGSKKTSSSKKSSSKKKSKSKKSSSKKSSKQSGGKKMKSRLSPVNKNGLKLVTALGLLGAAILGKVAYDRYKMTGGNMEKTVAHTMAQLAPGMSARKILVAGVVIGTAAKVLDVRSYSFVQFS